MMVASRFGTHDMFLQARCEGEGLPHPAFFQSTSLRVFLLTPSGGHFSDLEAFFKGQTIRKLRPLQPPPKSQTG